MASGRSESNTPKKFFAASFEGEKGKLAVLNLGHQPVNGLIHSRGTFYVAVDLGTLKMMRFRVQTQPSQLPGDATAEWYTSALVGGDKDDAFGVTVTRNGLYAIPFVAHGARNVRLRVETESEGKGTLDARIGFQIGGAF